MAQTKRPVAVFLMRRKGGQMWVALRTRGWSFKELHANYGEDFDIAWVNLT